MKPFVSPHAQSPLFTQENKIYEQDSKRVVGEIKNGIPRFVKTNEHYAENFSWQWNYWQNAQSESRGSKLRHSENLKRRSGLWEKKCYTNNMKLLECGMGGGDDTEVLLTLPLKEIHSFDLTESVDRAAKFLKDDRLQISQSCIYNIPYPDEYFDIVWCHRVIQHTPDPLLAIRSICQKLKPGGRLFLHCYHKSFFCMQQFKYKYRFLTKRIPHKYIFWFLERFSPVLHWLNERLDCTKFGQVISHNFVPLYYVRAEDLHSEMSRQELIDWEKLATFDALTPKFDNPLSPKSFKEALHKNNIEISWLCDSERMPLLVRGIKKTDV